METVEVAIIGAGQAGLATSYYLTQANVEHVILEAGRVAETWRSRRWDSFCLVTPNWSVRLPGAAYDGPDPDGYMGRSELVDRIETWAHDFRAPVREQCPVESLDPDRDGFDLIIPAGKLRARTVVVASGGYQKPHLPAHADQMPAGVAQILADDYRNPREIPPGAVLIVGSGQTGCQIAEELHESGRKVYLACGKCSWAPRRFGGHDLVWWTVESGFWDRTVAQLASPGARLFGNVLASGHGGGHDMHFRTLHAAGIELTGRYLGVEEGRVHLADDLAETVDVSDRRAADFKKWVDALCAREGWPIPFEMPPPMRIKTRTTLDLARDDIGAVIWTTGFRPAYGWVHLNVFDDLGFPIQRDGRSEVPGLYFMGVHFQRKAQSAVLYGVGEDAQLVAEHIVENRR